MMKEETRADYRAGQVVRYQEIQLVLKVNEIPKVEINDSQGAHKYLRHIWPDDISVRERFIVLYVNQKNRPIGYFTVSIGGVNATHVDTSLIFAPIFAEAYKMCAAAIFISHNHPSGNLQASKADRNITKDIKEVAKIHKITVLDHIILVPNHDYYSFADNGEL